MSLFAAVRHLIAFRRCLPVTVQLDPDDPSPRHLAECLAQVAARLDERPERMRMVIRGAAKGGLPVVMDSVEDGSAFRITCGRGSQRFSSSPPSTQTASASPSARNFVLTFQFGFR